MARYRHGKSTLQRIYEIGGADLALRYNEIASQSEQRSREYRLIHLRFYTRKHSGAEREFGADFPRSSASWIYFELEVENPWSSIQTDHQVRARFIRPDGSEMGVTEDKVETEEGQRTFVVAWGRGWDEPGNWQPGTYRVEIEVAWKPLGSGQFTIYQDLPKMSLLSPSKKSPASEELGALAKALFGDSSTELKKPSTEPAAPKGLGFDGWMKKLKADFPSLGTPVLDPQKPLDDMAKMRWLHEIDRRFRFAIPNAGPGRADATVIAELKGVAADYEKLLTAGLPKIPIYTEESVREKIADAHSWIARAAESMRDHREAESEYKKAGELFIALGKSTEADRCRSSLASLKYSEGGNVNAEVIRLRTKLAKTPAGSLDYAETLSELAGIISSGGLDDHEAEKLYLEAEGILGKLSDEKGQTIGSSSGKALASALESSLLNLLENKPGGFSPIERMLKVNGLQQQVCLGLARIYDKTQRKKAEQYRQKAGRMDTRKVNNDFSEAMHRALKGKLGSL